MSLQNLFPGMKYIWFDGEFSEVDKVTISPLVHSLHYGGAVFGGGRAYNGNVVMLPQRTQRLIKSARLLGYGIPFTEEELSQAVLSVVAKNKLKDAYIRDFAFRGICGLGLKRQATDQVHVGIFALYWPNYLGEEAIKNGANVVITGARRPHPKSYLVGAKASQNYAFATTESTRVKDRFGADEVLFLDWQGRGPIDGAGEELGAIVDNTVIFPPDDAGILSGTTMNYFLKYMASDLGFTVKRRIVTLREIKESRVEEMFFIGNAVEVLGISKVQLALDGNNVTDKIVLSGGTAGPKTMRIREEFIARVTGQKPTKNLLTPVNYSQMKISTIKAVLYYLL